MNAYKNRDRIRLVSIRLSEAREKLRPRSEVKDLIKNVREGGEMWRD